MVRALFFTLILITHAFGTTVEYCDSTVSPESRLTFFESAIFHIAKQTHQKANPNEAKYFSKHLVSSLMMKDLKILATQQSQYLCHPKWLNTSSKRKDTEDNEVDAVRHFVLSTLLGYFHPEEALPILLNHEVSGKKPLNKQNLMDMYNNQLGMSFGEELKKKNKKMSKLDIAYAASEKALYLLKTKELRTLKAIKYGPCKNLPSQNDQTIKHTSVTHRSQYEMNQRSCIVAALDCGIEL